MGYLVCTMPKNRGVLAFFTCHTGYELRPYESSVACCMYIHLCDNMQYLLSVTYNMMCTGLVLRWKLSPERVVAQSLHYIFFSRCKRVGI